MKKKSPASYQARTYRSQAEAAGLVFFSITIRETDLQIMATCNLEKEAAHLVLQARNHIETFIDRHPEFLTALRPLPQQPLAPGIVKNMLRAAEVAGVGPMAAVAGAIAEFVGSGLQKAGADEVIVENGGDVFLARNRDCLVQIFAGTSPLSNKVGIRLAADRMPLGVCTSSGSVGHSLSMGKADSATVIAKSASLADAAATALGNLISKKNDINTALASAKEIPGISGAVLIHEDRLGAWGNVTLEPVA